MVSDVTVITVLDIVSLGLINLTVAGNGSYQFCQFRNEVWCPCRNSSVGYTVFAQDEIPSSWLLQTAVIDQDNPLWTSLELSIFWYHQHPLKFLAKNEKEKEFFDSVYNFSVGWVWTCSNLFNNSKVQI